MSPAQDDRVLLKLGGREYAGWTEVQVTRSIEAAAASFDLTVTERYPGQRQPLRISPGDPCTVYIGGELLITGYVDDVGPEYDDQQHSIHVAGRSRTQDLVDCSAVNVPGQWKNVKLEVIASEMAAKYGVTVRAEVDTGAPIPDFQIQQGETVFAAIERMARLKAVLLTDDPGGALVITRAGKAGTATALVLGKNIKAGSGNFSQRERFSDYIVKGQRAGDDETSGAAAAATHGTAKDSGVRRKRTLVLVAEAQADNARCAARARWEASSRAGKSVEVTYTVQGWRQKNGALWPVNAIVQVDDSFMTVGGALLIAGATMAIGEQGTLTTLTLQPPGAFELIPELEDADAKDAAGDAGAWKSLT